MPTHCPANPVADHVIATIVGPPIPVAPPGHHDHPDHPDIELRDGAPPSIHQVLASRLARSVEGDHVALDPCPDLDRVLHRLVQLLVSPAGAMGGSATDDGPVAIEVAERLDRDDLRPRADTIRLAAGLAEARMEHHYAAVLEESWRRSGPAAAAVDRTADPVGRLCRLLHPFPYVENYLHLVDAEIRALAATGRPATSVAVCGSGPLPLTGLLFQVLLGCRVTLIDHDPLAARSSAALVGLLEDLGVLAEGAVEVVPTAAERASVAGHDVVLVAALVPQDALITLAGRLVGRRPADGPMTLLARSARGLVARLAYRALEPGSLTRRGLTHLGTVLPDNAGGTAAPGADSDLTLALAHPEVLNCTEVFALP